MTQPKRPALSRRVTRASEQERKSALEAGVALTLDGERYELRMGDVTSELARELRRATGFGFRQLMAELTRDPDVDLIAAFVWAARVVRGERVDFDSVTVGYAEILGDDFDVDVVGADDEAEAGDGVNPEG